MTTLQRLNHWRQVLNTLRRYPLGSSEYEDLVTEVKEKIQELETELEAELQPLNVQLTNAREAAGLTITKVADRVDLSREHLGRLEKGVHQFTSELTMCLMDIYGLNTLTFKDESGFFITYTKGEGK